MKRTNLPDFIGIGTHRSGTTWLYEMLKQHPEITMSPEKEVNYFGACYDKGIEWYSNFFRACDGRRVRGEFSPLYLADERAPGRIQEVLPEVKLIVSLRNPVDQIFSRYCYLVARQMQSGSFEEVLEQHAYLIQEAYYYRHLSRFLEHFRREQLLILLYDDLLADPAAFLRSVYAFLGVDAVFLPENVGEKIHFSRDPRSRRLEAAVVMTRTILRKLRLFRLIQVIKSAGLDKGIKRLNTSKNGGWGPIRKETRTRLNRLFLEDKQMLSLLIGRDVTFWS